MIKRLLAWLRAPRMTSAQLVDWCYAAADFDVFGGDDDEEPAAEGLG
jgi:hypothetical protein